MYEMQAEKRRERGTRDAKRFFVKENWFCAMASFKTGSCAAETERNTD
jgi:hypothetical protein